MNTSRKSPITFAVAAMLTTTMLSQTVGFSMISTASAAEMTQKSARVDSNLVIRGAFQKLKRETAKGSLIKKDDALAGFTRELAENNVGLSEVDSYALTSYDSLQEYNTLHDAISIAQEKVELGQDATEANGRVFELMMQHENVSGLSIAGCGAFVGGIVLAIGAVVVGIIALVNTKGAGKIKADYEQRKADLKTQYDKDTAYYINWKTTIPADIAAHQSKISYDQSKISYYNGVIAGSDASTPTGAQQIKDASYYLQQYNSDISAQQQAISELNVQMASYTANPSLVQGIIDGYTSVYNGNLQALQTEEDSKIANVPQNKKNAKTLGIVAGISAALAVVLLVGNDGTCD